MWILHKEQPNIIRLLAKENTSPSNSMTHPMRQVSTLKAKCFPLLLITKISSISSACLRQEQFPRLASICPLPLATQKVMYIYSLSLAQQWKLYINSRKAVWADWSTVGNIPIYDLWLRDKHIYWKVEIFLLIFWPAPHPANGSQLMKGIVLIIYETRTANLVNNQMLTSTSLITSKTPFITCFSEEVQLFLLLI